MNNIYPDITSDIPPNTPEQHGKYIQITCVIDATHAGDRVIQRLHMIIMIYYDHAHIPWLLKK